MTESKEVYEQFETDNKEEEAKKKKEEKKKAKKKFWKRIKNVGLFFVFIIAIVLIVRRSREIQSLQKKIEGDIKEENSAHYENELKKPSMV